MADTTDGKKSKPTDKYKRVPEGERVIIILDLVDKDEKGKTQAKTVVSRMKEGTAKFLGLSPAKGIQRSEKKGVIRGSKGSKSFVLLLNKPANIGGATVQTLSVPVPSTVGLVDFYAYAQKFKGKGVTGIRTPNGVSYRFGIDTSDDK
jgi:hypothetical protein